jgi:hypothetical protein
MPITSSLFSLGHLQHALDHGERVGVEQVFLVSGVENFHQLFPVVRFGREPRPQAFHPTRFGRFIHATALPL